MINADVQVRILGTQHDLSDEQMETICTGRYKKMNGKHVVIYDEFFEEENGQAARNTNILKVSDGFLSIKKSGAITTTMEFEEGKNTFTIYKTPYGTFNMMIHTNSLKIKEDTDRLTLYIDYSLSLNGQQVSECSISIFIN